MLTCGDRTLRLLRESDAPELQALIEANRSRLARWMPWAQGQTLDDTAQFIARTRRQLVQNDGFQLAMLADGRIAGVVGFLGVDWSARASSIGFWLSREEQGRGTMTRAAGCLVAHAFAAWQLERLEIRADVQNLRSQAVAQRLGFERDALLPAAAAQGGESDQFVYSLSAASWRAAHPQLAPRASGGADAGAGTGAGDYLPL